MGLRPRHSLARHHGPSRNSEFDRLRRRAGAADARTARCWSQALALGVCGTDREIIAGDYGEAPDGHERLILGHESLGRVLEAPEESDLAPGDHVVGIVRHPDPVPCPACASGQWDMCRNGQYTEHGIKGLNGFGAERWRIAPQFAVKVDRALGLLGVLLEPTSVVAKAWDHVRSRVAARSRAAAARYWSPAPDRSACSPRCSACSAAIEVHVYDHNDDRPEAASSRARSAPPIMRARSTSLATLAPDIMIECTGVPAVIAALLSHVAPDGVDLPHRRRRLASRRLRHRACSTATWC